MHQRSAPILALGLSFFLTAISPAVWATEPYAFKPFGGSVASRTGSLAARYTVTIIDRTWYDAERGRNVPVKIYAPNTDGQSFPVIIFSTGLGQSRDDCAYLGRHWASCGYVSVHVQHKGSDEEARVSLRPRKELQRAFYSPQNIRNRPLDVLFVLHQLDAMSRDDSDLAKKCDLSKIGVSGHDFGAQTVLGVAGQVLPGRISFAEPRVKAIVAMSEPVPLGQVPLDVAYGDIALPCLHITGTADNSIVATTQAYQRRLPFDHTSASDQYLVTFYGADHMVYSGHLRPANGPYDAMFRRLIAECSAVFWDAYLKNDAGAKAWLAEGSLKSYLATTARVEKK